jgi:hypothetical protein
MADGWRRASAICMNRQVVALGGTRKLASADTGPRISSVRLAIGYAVMVAALAATLLGSFTLGSRLEPVPNAAGVYRLDPRAQCLGGQIEVWQSGRFTDIAGERGSGGSLELHGRRLTGKVGCADGSTAPLQATVAGEAGDRSLSGEVGGHRFRATLIRDHPEPAEPVVRSGEPLTPEELFGRLMLAIAAHVWALLHHRLGWSVQRPVRRAAERDQDAVDRWVKETWPRIKQTPTGAEPAWSSSTKARSA